MAPELSEAAIALAEELGLPLAGEAEFALQLSTAGLQLQELGQHPSGPVRVDFLEGALAHRRLHGGGSGQMIAKAVGIQSGIRPTILDATAGLGRDAFVLAQLGCSVILIERNAMVGALLADGIQRGLPDPEVGPILQRMHFLPGNAIKLIENWIGEPPQVIYLDPMFPHRGKNSLVKKEMRLFRPLVGDDDDAPQLLKAALALATHRVVVKRPRKAPSVSGAQPGYTLEGKSSRFDIYPKRAFKTTA
ncbi:MAG: class I SAM-dependent methyltransferase [Azonexus sp.]|nr:class I SAM-dependent methyltransferase [Azonexus sp.]